VHKQGIEVSGAEWVRETAAFVNAFVLEVAFSVDYEEA